MDAAESLFWAPAADQMRAFIAKAATCHARVSGLLLSPRRPSSSGNVRRVARRSAVDRLGCPRLLALAPLQAGKLVDEPRALAISAVKRRHQPRLLSDEVLGGGVAAALDFDDGDAHIIFSFAGAFQLIT
jgi:hypothetical protein